jgi:hypothetical protein
MTPAKSRQLGSLGGTGTASRSASTVYPPWPETLVSAARMRSSPDGSSCTVLVNDS